MTRCSHASRCRVEHAIRRQLAHPLVEFVGEVGDRDKDEVLGNAYAYLFPIDWPEPFGLTMVEAMACGTPVIAMRCGSVPEVVADGVSGFVCSSMRGFIDAVPRAGSIDRAACRAYAEIRFSAAAMTDGYEEAYARLTGITNASDRSRSESDCGSEDAPLRATAWLDAGMNAPFKQPRPETALGAR